MFGQIVLGSHGQLVSFLNVNWLRTIFVRGYGLPFLTTDGCSSCRTSINCGGCADVFSIQEELRINSTVMTG
jgi:hypothetical protein